MMKLAPQHLLVDEPIQLAKDDAFNRLPIAVRISELLDHLRSQADTGVIAILGEWGSGKSSVLNLTKPQLDKPSWKVVRFNPWLVSDTSSLVSEFFLSVFSELPEELTGTEKFKSAMGRYVGAVVPLAKSLESSGIPLIGGAVTGLHQILEGQSSTLEDQQQVLAAALKELNYSIAVIIDDLDRLHPDELLLTLKLVRLVGKLPNVYYLLSFDEHTVLDVIEKSDLAQGDRSRAHAYLEKIIQLRFDLPPIHYTDQGALFELLLDQVLSAHNLSLASEATDRLAGLYHEQLRKGLTQPRSVRRFLAHFDSIIPLIGDEVDLIDLLGLTFLRVTQPDLYRLVAKNRAEFAGRGRHIFESAEEAVERVEHRADDLLEEARLAGTRKSQARDLLGWLFPSIHRSSRGECLTGWEVDELTRGRRIGSPDYVDRYFQLSVPADDVSDQIIAHAVASISSGVRDEEASAALEDALVSSPGRVLTKLAVQVEQLSASEAANFLDWFCLRISRIPRGAGLLGDLSHTQARSLLSELLLRAEGLKPATVLSRLQDDQHAMTELLGALVAAVQRLESTTEAIEGGWVLEMTALAREHIFARVVEDLRQGPEHAELPILRLRYLAQLPGSDELGSALLEELRAGGIHPVDLAALNVPVGVSSAGEESLMEFRWSIGDLVPLDVIVELGSDDLDAAPRDFPEGLNEEDTSFENRRLVACVALNRYRSKASE